MMYRHSSPMDACPRASICIHYRIITMPGIMRLGAFSQTLSFHTRFTIPKATSRLNQAKSGSLHKTWALSKRLVVKGNQTIADCEAPRSRSKLSTILFQEISIGRCWFIWNMCTRSRKCREGCRGATDCKGPAMMLELPLDSSLDSHQ